MSTGRGNVDRDDTKLESGKGQGEDNELLVMTLQNFPRCFKIQHPRISLRGSVRRSVRPTIRT